MMKFTKYSHFLRYIFVGVLNSFVGYGVYFIFIYFGFHYSLALIIAHPIGVFHSFLWNKYWTFRDKKNTSNEKYKFVAVYVVTFFINLLLLFWFIDILGFSSQIGGLLALVLVTVIAFFGHKYWSFRSIH